MKPFLKVSEIETIIDNNYNDYIFLTFDIDWASDEVLTYCLDLIEQDNVKATFFVTHKTKVLEQMRENPNIELGIHPNFNFLLNGDFRYGKNYLEVIDYYLEMVPEAQAVRSHFLVQSTQILDAYIERGLKYDLNLYIPRNSNIDIKPFNHWQKGLKRLPHFWEDDLHLLYNDTHDVSHYLTASGLKIFDFHPIHIFLNTENIQRYENSKPFLNNFNKLKNSINTNKNGIKTFYKDIVLKSN